jgi:hypothetical protein
MSIIEGEMDDLLEAIWMASNRGLGHMVFESDSQVLIDSIHSRVRGVSEFSAVISSTSIVTGLSFHLNLVEVRFVRRLANMVVERPFLGLVTMLLRFFLLVLNCI